ncbi:MAG: agmatinase [Promethearchaeota archaeon]
MSLYGFDEEVKEDTEFVIFGIPWDYLTSINSSNSAIAPAKIREVSKDLALTTEKGYKIPLLKAVDLGDVNIKAMKVDDNILNIQEYVKDIYSKNKKVILVMIGGDHFCTYPVVKAVGDNFKKKEVFGVLLFDAHLDLYDQWDKGIYSHATVSHRIYDLKYVNNKNILIVGTRDIDIEELEIAKKENISYLNAYELSQLGLNKYKEKIITFFKNSSIKDLYISIDIDVLDPSSAPGTGFPIPGGLSYRELWMVLENIVNNFNIIAFDVIEVAPNLDPPNKMTVILAAKLITEFMAFISNKR